MCTGCQEHGDKAVDMMTKHAKGGHKRGFFGKGGKGAEPQGGGGGMSSNMKKAPRRPARRRSRWRATASIDMAESTLNLKLGTYMGQVGHFLGWGFGASSQNYGAYSDTTWSTFQLSEVSFAVQSGISQFYFSNEWTFLKPTSQIQIPVGVSVVQLPDDFEAAFEGDLTCRISDHTPTANYRPVPFILPGQIDQMYSANATASGPMAYASNQPIKGTTMVGATREQLYFFPVSDQVYVANIRYYILADMLTGAAPYVYGGGKSTHRRSFRAACRSRSSGKDNEIGPQNARRAERLLQMSKMADSRLRSPQHFGRNKDTSDAMRGRGPYPFWNVGPNTYNGNSMNP